MECNNGITVSDSLFRLINQRQYESQCLRLLVRALKWHRGCYPINGQLFPDGSNYKRIVSRLLNPDLPGNYFSYREKQGMISFMPKGKEQKFNNDGTWKRDGRQSVKPGKWIRSMLHPRALRFLKTGDHLFAEFNSIVRHEELRQAVSFEQVPVTEAYRRRNFSDVIGSCMWDEPVGEFYDSFGCRAVVAVGSEGLWRARAILWKNVQVDDGNFDQTFMDRIYADSEEVVLAMKEYARKNKWWYKSCQDRGTGSSGHQDRDAGHVRMKVKTEQGLDALSFYPYLDTFHTGGYNYLCNNDHSGDYVYQSTDGTREPEEEDHEGQVIDAYGEWLDEDDAVSVNGEYYHQDSDEIVYCDKDDQHYLKSECSRVKIGREWQIFHNDDVEALS